MDYKKFRTVNIWINLIGAVLSAVSSIIMMFFPEENASMSIFPWLIASIIVNLRIFGMTLRNDYDQEEYAKSISEAAESAGKTEKVIAVVTAVALCLTAVLMIIKIFMH